MMALTLTTHELEFKPGGTWRFVMHGPDGRDYKNEVWSMSKSPSLNDWFTGMSGLRTFR